LGERIRFRGRSDAESVQEEQKDMLHSTGGLNRKK
jgi:hypothetical protein